MNLIINQNQVRINQVQNDAQLNAFVQGEFTDEASLVVIDYDEN